jgi:hyperosmotically inducible protein
MKNKNLKIALTISTLLASSNLITCSSYAYTDAKNITLAESSHTVKEAANDSVITTEIKGKLLADSQVSSFKISVETTNGNVHLSGEVPNKEIEGKVVSIAKSINGVSNVDSHLSINSSIEVSPNHDTGLATDTVITTKVKTQLLADSTVSGLDIHVTTIKGVVTLSGTVPSSDAEKKAVEIAKSVNDVTNVESHLVVDASATSTVDNVKHKASEIKDEAVDAASDAGKKVKNKAVTTKNKAKLLLDESTITAKIKAKYVKDDLVSALDIHVVTKKGGVVTLTGMVPNTESAERAVSIAKNTDGVDKVVSNLKVAR